jgi:general secretion pathway protein G
MVSKPGFTLTEILIAIALVAIMAAVTVPFFMGYLTRAKIRSTQQTLLTIKGSIESFYADVGQYPNKLQDLIERPRDPKLAKKWLTRYMEKDEIPEDAWGNEIQYKKTSGGQHPFELYSYGANGPDAPAEDWKHVWDI